MRKTVTCFLSRCQKWQKFHKFMGFGAISFSRNIHKENLMYARNKFYEGNRKGKFSLEYCSLFTVFATFSVLLYQYREKLKLSNLFTVHALDFRKSSLRDRFNFVADVVEECGDAVVCIESVVSRFGKKCIMALGSGFIVREDGLILTNAHVVLNKPNSFQVKLKDGRIFPAHIENMDLNVDLATIKINGVKKKLPTMKLGVSTDLRAGEWVIAIGSPLTLKNSVSAGVVSAPQRKGEDLGMDNKDIHYIQTDVGVTFGNSGGPLVNLDGEVIGVNSMIVITGISLAIPVEYVTKFLEVTKKEDATKDFTGFKKSYIGVVMFTITPHILQELNHKGMRMPDHLVNKVLICEVAQNSPASQSGLRPGDIVAEINDQEVYGSKSMHEALELGVPLKLKIFRGNQMSYITVFPVPVT